MAQELIDALHEQDKIDQLHIDLQLDNKSDIGHTHAEYVNKSGDTMTGSLDMGTNIISNIGDGVQITDVPSLGQTSTMVQDLRDEMEAGLQSKEPTITVGSPGQIWATNTAGDGKEWINQPEDAIWGNITGTLSNQTDLQNALNLKADESDLSSHTNNISNPHSVNKSQIGLGSVDNTSDIDKPISTATQVALDSKEPNLVLGIAGQIMATNATADGYEWADQIDNAVWGSIAGTLSNQTDLQAALDLKANEVDMLSHTSNTDNPHIVTKTHVGLSNVDNTSDADKPISTETQTALDDKQELLISGSNIKTINGSTILGSGDLPIGAINDIFYENAQEVTQDYTLTAGKNAMSAGPVTVADGIIVTVPDGARWTIV